MIESKFLSGPSSEVDDKELPHHQLARELDQLSNLTGSKLHWDTQLELSTRSLLYITKDADMPKDDLGKAEKEYSEKRHPIEHLYWTSWLKLPTILQSALKRETVSEYRVVLEDLLQLLACKGLAFLGVEPILNFISIPGFYEIRESVYVWPNIVLSPSFEYESRPQKYLWPLVPSPSLPYSYEPMEAI